MADISIGCSGFVGGREAYWHVADLVELLGPHHGAPKRAPLRKLRKQAGPDKGIIVVASQLVTHPAEDPAFRFDRQAMPSGPCGLLRDTEAVAAGWQSTVQAAEACEAQGVLLRTPPAFTPSTAHRAALARFTEAALADLSGRALAWDPAGLWEPEEAAALATELGLVCAVDPLRDEPAEGPLAYFRLRGLLRYSDDDLLDVLEHAADFDRAWVLFDHPDRLRDAKRAKRLLAEV